MRRAVRSAFFTAFAAGIQLSLHAQPPSAPTPMTFDQAVELASSPNLQVQAARRRTIAKAPSDLGSAIADVKQLLASERLPVGYTAQIGAQDESQQESFRSLPLAFGLGSGADLQKPLAIAVIGGPSVSTIVTLVFVPTLISILPTKRAMS